MYCKSNASENKRVIAAASARQVVQGYMMVSLLPGAAFCPALLSFTTVCMKVKDSSKKRANSQTTSVSIDAYNLLGLTSSACSNDRAVLVLQDSTSGKRLVAFCLETQKVRGQTSALMHLLRGEVTIKPDLMAALSCSWSMTCRTKDSITCIDMRRIILLFSSSSVTRQIHCAMIRSTCLPQHAAWFCYHAKHAASMSSHAWAGEGHASCITISDSNELEFPPSRLSMLHSKRVTYRPAKHDTPSSKCNCRAASRQY